MDEWKFRDISYRDHVICDPLSLDKVDCLLGLFSLGPDTRLLDIGCGKGEVLIRAAERFSCAGVGVDLSPIFVSAARATVLARAPGLVEIVEDDGAAFVCEAGSVDVGLCLGATFAFGGYRATLRALGKWVKPGGLVVVGEPFLKRFPQPPEVAAAEVERSKLQRHFENAADGASEGMELLDTLVSSDDEWDRYRGLQWRATERWAAEHPDDPDVSEVLQRQHQSRDRYLRWERDCIGWGVYVFRR